MNEDKTIYLLVVDDSSNLTETVSNTLRNAGHAVRADRIEDDEDLIAALDKQPWDMIITRPEISYFNASDAIGIVKQANLDLPVIIIADDVDTNIIDELVKQGARDHVYLSNPMRLEKTILREAHDARQRRSLVITESALEEANSRAQVLVDSSRDAITYVHEGMHIYANESYMELFGYPSQEDIEGVPIMDMVKSDEHAKFKQFLRDYTKGKAKESSLSVTGIKTDGEEFNVNMEFTPASFEGEPCTQIIIRDQAMSKELEQQLSDMSKKDILTGAFNRPYFMEGLQKACSAKDEGAVLSIRLDNYKRIREELGISASDELLAQFAKMVAEEMPHKNDFISRFEGDIFTILLHNIGAEDAESFAQQLCKKVEEYIFETSGTSSTTPCSIGIGIYNETLQEHQEVINRAEKAMGQANKAGGNRAQIYVVDEKEMADKERSAILARQIKLALKNNTITLLYQPIVSLKDDANKNYEIFSRIRVEGGNEILPKDFIPAAQAHGLMGAVDRWIIAHAIKNASEQHAAGVQVRVFVKLSDTSLKDQSMLGWLGEILKAAHAKPNTLVLCVNENVASNNLSAMKMLTAGLNQLHVHMALDNFGHIQNYNNLLKHCDVDFLKLDGAIIGKLSSDKQSLDKVNNITALAAEEEMKVIANAVEDPHTLATIYSTGVDYIQGYFLQEPSSEMDYDFSSM